MEVSYTKSIPLAKSNQLNKYDFMTRSAFTLIEIMVVIAIIVTVSGFVIARIQVDDTKALALETTKLADTIEYMRSLSGASNARECPAFTGADSAKIPKLTRITLYMKDSISYEVKKQCDSQVDEDAYDVLFTRKLLSGNSFVFGKDSKVVTFFSLNRTEASETEGYVEEIKILSASKNDCSCIKILATGLPLTSISCRVDTNECQY